ncbi:MAG: efflux RND transporter periplasmic adaptor subunit [Mangrovibacterium sp.]
MKANLYRFSLIALTVFSGALIFSSCGGKKAESPLTGPKVQATVAVAELKDYPSQYSFSGKIEADKQATLSTRMMGQVERIYVKRGQQVKQGDLLLQIRNKDVLAKKAQVEASKVEASTAFASAEKDLKRFEALYATNSASDKEMDDIRTHYQMAKARLEAVAQMEKEVEESIRYTAIRAPYNGVITGKFIEEGDMANPGMPLLGMESPAQWKVIARIPESDIARLKLNDPVKVNINAMEGLILDGTIAEINPSAGTTGNQFEAKIVINTRPEQTNRLYSGMYATVIYEKGTSPLMLVPQTALVHRGQLTGIYTVSQNGTALLRWIRPGKIFGDSVEVLSGLTDGEKYIQRTEGKLYDGALIEN